MDASEDHTTDASVHVLSKWRLVLRFWGAQAVFVALLGPVWIMQGDTVDGPEHPFGQWHWDRIANLLSRWEYWGTILLVIAGLVFLQMVLIWPVRRPRARNAKGWPLWLSLGAAALVGTAMAAGIVLALCTVAEINSDLAVSMNERTAMWLFAGWCVASYTVGGALMYGFCSRRLRQGERHESVLARLAAILFTGTLVEAVAVMPLDVMFRRRSDCYCFAGTFWAYTLLLAAGLVTIGPAILLPILARRRKRWYASRCDCCGYDMSGLLTSERTIDRCPECGAGWRM